MNELKNNYNFKKFVFLTCECQWIPFQPMPSDVGGKNPELKKVGTNDYSLIMDIEFQEKVKNCFYHNRFCGQQGMWILRTDSCSNGSLPSSWVDI